LFGGCYGIDGTGYEPLIHQQQRQQDQQHQGWCWISIDENSIAQKSLPEGEQRGHSSLGSLSSTKMKEMM
jgi:hypothetical protein